eukprot:scaffold616115_cov94-Attheya_sp.AAC.1
MICERTPVVFDHAHLKYLGSLEDPSHLLEALTKLMPSLEGDTTMCKPSSWNQCGYDVVRIVKVGPFSYDLMFGQVMKSAIHSLKMKFFKEFVDFFTKFNLVISAVEIGMIVPSGGTDTRQRLKEAKAGRQVESSVAEKNCAEIEVPRSVPSNEEEKLTRSMLLGTKVLQ